jgi:hypothetical protein
VQLKLRQWKNARKIRKMHEISASAVIAMTIADEFGSAAGPSGNGTGVCATHPRG